MEKTKASLSYNFIVALLITALFFVVTHKVYHLPFSYGDDHRALAMLHPDKVSDTYKSALYGYTPDLKGTFGIDEHIGRFRPLSWAYDKLLCVICGDNTHLFRLSNLIILFLSAFFLLGIFTAFGVDKLSSLIVLAIYVFGRNNETWWVLIPPPQNIGEMFLLAGIWVWLLYRNKGKTGLYLLPAFLFLLASISKESFIFCVPVILLTDYLFFNPSKKLLAKEYWASLLACFIPFLCLLAIVLHIHKIYSYTYPESVISIAAYNVFQFVGASVFFIAPIVVWFFIRKRLPQGFLFKLIAVFAIWGVVQLVLLKGIKLDIQHHYLIPWLIYPFILTAIAFSELKKASGKWYIVTLLAYGVATLLFARNTYSNTSSYTAELQAYYNMLDTVKKDTSATKIIYIGDNACLGDWINGTQVIMDNIGIKKELYFTTTTDSIPAWQKNYAEHSPQNAFKHMPLDSALNPDYNGPKWLLFIENPAKNGEINENIRFHKRVFLDYDSLYMADDDDAIVLHGTGRVEYNTAATVPIDSDFFYTRDTLNYIMINGKDYLIQGKVYYFSVPYPGRSIGDILRGNHNAINRKGFYAIRLDELVIMDSGC